MAQQIPTDTNIVMRKLKIHECTINGLFSLRYLPLTIIKNKLTELSSLVADIPAGLGEVVFSEWNMKLAQWWAQYAEWMDKCQQNEPTQVYGLNHSNFVSFGSDFVEQQKNIATYSEVKLAKPNTDDIKHQIEHEFAALPALTSSTDIDGMKCLLLQISQSLKFYDAKVYKHILFCELFTIALAKLPTELCEHFRQINSSVSSSFLRLFGLRQFIANQIVNSYRQNAGLFTDKSIDTIGEQLTHEFGELPKVTNENCIEQVKAILTGVSKAKFNLHPFRNIASFNQFNQLQSNLFDLAFSKLSLTLQKVCAQLNAIKQKPKQLSTLAKVLSKHVVDYYAKKRATQAEHIQLIQSVVRECASNGEDAKFCQYCNSVGHSAGQCEELASMTCYNCLQTGHSAKSCKTATCDRTHSLFCFECVQFGHFAGYCPTVVCARCKQSGHMARQCANN